MLTLKEHSDGELYHAECRVNPETDEYEEESTFLYDEYGNLIPAHICLCHAYEPGECCCATTSWENYRYDDDY